MLKIENKKTIFSLKSIKGVGINKSNLICNLAGIGKGYRYSELSDQQKNKIDKIIKNRFNFTAMPVDYIERQNIQRLKDMKCYRGDRHSKNYPVRGQRTHSNSSTQKKINYRQIKNRK